MEPFRNVVEVAVQLDPQELLRTLRTTGTLLLASDLDRLVRAVLNEMHHNNSQIEDSHAKGLRMLECLFKLGADPDRKSSEEEYFSNRFDERGSKHRAGKTSRDLLHALWGAEEALRRAPERHRQNDLLLERSAGALRIVELFDRYSKLEPATLAAQKKRAAGRYLKALEKWGQSKK